MQLALKCGQTDLPYQKHQSVVTLLCSEPLLTPVSINCCTNNCDIADKNFINTINNSILIIIEAVSQCLMMPIYVATVIIIM